MSRKQRRHVEGANRVPPTPPIDLPFTIANFRAILATGFRGNGPHTHQQIVTWAAHFWWTQSERPTSLGLNVAPEIEKAAELAQDVEMQWDMYLANTYTLAELQSLDFSQVRLPATWFADWIAELDRLTPPSDFEEGKGVNRAD